MRDINCKVWRLTRTGTNLFSNNPCHFLFASFGHRWHDNINMKPKTNRMEDCGADSYGTAQERLADFYEEGHEIPAHTMRTDWLKMAKRFARVTFLHAVG